MLEKLYTRKVIVALMAVILAANGFLLYQFQINPPTEAANTPSSTGTPEIPDSPATEPQNPDEEGQPENETQPDEASSERDSSDENSSEENENPPSEAPAVESPSAEAPSTEAPGGSTETPFDSQYGSAPTSPSVSVDGSGGGLDRIQVALASLYDPEGGDSGRVRILPATSGFALVPVFGVLAFAMFAAGIAAFHRKWKK